MAMSSRTSSSVTPALHVGLLSFALCTITCILAYGQSDSPCNEGRDPFREPRNPYAICLPEIGRMDDFQGPCPVLGGGGQFGNQLAPVGDVDHSGTADFVVGHRLCDSNLSVRAEELLLYRGVKGALPMSNTGERIGPTERNSITAFLAAGDWDDDGNIDIAVNIEVLGDTSEGNTEGYGISRQVVFWGNDSGKFSLSDTTRLLPGSVSWQTYPLWIGYAIGASIDLDGDGVDDLVEAKAGAFENGRPQPLPNILVYRGHRGERWGRNGVSRIADRHYWNPRTPSNVGIEPTRIVGLDQDRDGADDAVFYADDGIHGAVSILYGGVSAELPDTNAMQTVSIKKVGTGYSLFTDITGDGVPELLACSGVADVVKVYIGFKGQRLLEQFGSGDDLGDPDAEQWWGKPWATIWLPRKINPYWFGNDDRLFDLGDVNRDGIGDIFAFSWPYIVEYNGGGRLDSMVDALINITPGTEIGILKRLGDINGSGRDIIALTTGNEIRFYMPTKDVSSLGIDRKLPPGTGRKPGDVAPQRVTSDDQRVLTAVPNPSRGEIHFSWRTDAWHGPATITLNDISGREVASCTARGEEGSAYCPVHDLPAGIYLAQLRCGAFMSSTRIVLR